MQCPPGLLGKHFEKLIQCDPRLNYLSQQAEITLKSPYFEPRTSVFDESDDGNSKYDMNRDGRPPIFNLQDVPSSSGPQSSSSKNGQYDFHGTHQEQFSRETPSPSPSSGNIYKKSTWNFLGNYVVILYWLLFNLAYNLTVH